MMYIIEKANIKLSDNTRRIISFNTSEINESNSTNDIELFKKQLRDKIDLGIDILGVKVNNIFLTYYEIDGRQ